LISLFSPWLLGHRIARTAPALERIAVAKQRILSVLDRETVAHEKTLEQKISDQGPEGRRVDPHLVTLAIQDMIHLNRIATHRHPTSRDVPWYANIGTAADAVQAKLDTIAPLYVRLSQTLNDKVGDALEIITYQSLSAARAAAPRYHFEGSFALDRPKNAHGRYISRKPPMQLHARITNREPDFLQHGHDAGTICIECKNRREWLYPQSQLIKHHILRCHELDAIPVFIFRRIHYSTLTNLLFPAGIIAHESLYQYYPSDEQEAVTAAKHKRSLGFTDLLATEEPHRRTVRFFTENLPRIVTPMADKWRRNRQALVEYANGDLNLAQLYNAIDSRAGRNWVDQPEEAAPEE